MQTAALLDRPICEQEVVQKRPTHGSGNTEWIDGLIKGLARHGHDEWLDETASNEIQAAFH
jgi:hypothetical protein